MPLAFAGAAAPLAAGDIESVAKTLNCGPAVVRAICDVESAGSGFLADGRPKILFEAHQFWIETKGRFGHSNISSPAWDRSLYGAGGAHQYDRLAQAIKLARQSALRSASWGLFQIMGSNFSVCGFSDVEQMVTAMMTGERAHLDAFAAFCRANHLDDELRSTPPRFADFARGYNGSGFAANAYDVKLAAAWRKWSAVEATANPAPRTLPELYGATLQMNSIGPEVLALQARLKALGYDLDADADYGPETSATVVAFQKAHHLAPDGIAGPATMAAITRG